MAVLVSAGVLTREIDLSLYVPALSTTILGLVGTATKGPLNSPELITDVNQLERTYGNPDPNHPVILVAQWYLKYGRQCRLVRVANEDTVYSSSVAVPSALSGAAVVIGTVAGPYSITAAVAGTRTGTEVGPYTITNGVNDAMLLAIDGGADQPVDLTAGTRTAQQICDDINAQTTGVTAEVSGNKVKLTSNTTGATSSVRFKTVANSAYTDLGFSVAIYSGQDGTDTLVVSVDGGGDQTIVLTPGVVNATVVADEINAGLTGATASVNGNTLRIVTASTGGSASIQVKSASTADGILGFDNNVHNGSTAGATSVTFHAITAGTWGNTLKVKIQPATTYPQWKTITVFHNNIVVEVFRNLSKTPTDVDDRGNSAYWETVINLNSDYIRVIDNTSNTAQPADGVNFALGGGQDGLSGITSAEYIGTIGDGVRSGLQLFGDPEAIDVNLIAVPGQTAMEIHAEMLSMCEARADCMAILDPPLGLTPVQVVDFKRGMGSFALDRVALNSSYGAMYYPWVKGYDTTNRMIVDMPPSAPAIRTYIYNDIVGEVWFAPAGANRGRIVEATGIERTLTQGERDFLYENGVNPIANFTRHGVLIWGQKTLQSLPTALDRVNVRRLLLYLRKVIATAVFGLLFEPNTPRLWRRFVALVTPTLEAIQDREGLNAFKVVCDATTNTPDVIDRSEMRAKIGIKPTKAAEFIIIDFVIVNQASNFSEVVAATF